MHTIGRVLLESSLTNRRRVDLHGEFLSPELREKKVREFLTLKNIDMSMKEYNVKFTQLSHYPQEMVPDMKSGMSLFVVGLSGSYANRGYGQSKVDGTCIIN